MANKKLDKNRFDVAQAFLIFMATVGSCEQTAIALDVEPDQIKELAESEGWTEKIRRVSVMSKSGKPGDFERAQNRAMCFVQAHQIRQQLDRLLREVADMDSEELMRRCSVRTRDGGSQLSAKFLCDAAQTAEACHRMTYAALNDTVSEREERGKEGGEGGKASDLHSAIIAALSNPAAIVPSTTLLLEQTNARLSEQTLTNERKSSGQGEGEDA